MSLWDILQSLGNTGQMGAVIGSKPGRTGLKFISKSPQIAQAWWEGGRPGSSYARKGKGRSGKTGRSAASPSRSADLLERALRQQSQQEMVQGPNPLDQLLQMMQQMVGSEQGSTYSPDFADLMRQIRGQVDPVYDARRSAVEGMMGRAKERVGQGRQEVEGMYNALSGQYQQDAIAAQAAMEEAKAESESLTGQLRKNIKGTYSRIAGEQAELFKKLGIEEAAPEVMGAQASDQAWQESMASQAQQREAGYYGQLGASDKAYYAQGAPLAGLEGKNRSADMLSALQDYLAQSEGSLMELEGQRTSDINSAFNQLAMQAQQFAQQQTQQSQGNRWGQLMDLFGIMQPMYGPQEPGEMIGTGAQQIGAQLGLSPQENNIFQSAIAKLGSDPAVLYGQQINPETGQPVSTNRMAIANKIRGMGLPRNVENAMMIWLETAYK